MVFEIINLNAVEFYTLKIFVFKLLCIKLVTWSVYRNLYLCYLKSPYGDGDSNLTDTRDITRTITTSNDPSLPSCEYLLRHLHSRPLPPPPSPFPRCPPTAPPPRCRHRLTAALPPFSPTPCNRHSLHAAIPAPHFPQLHRFHADVASSLALFPSPFSPTLSNRHSLHATVADPPLSPTPPPPRRRHRSGRRRSLCDGFWKRRGLLPPMWSLHHR